MTTGSAVPHQPPIVGRQREQALLRAWRDEARAGETRMVLLVGEPGIGKTRLAEELASEARDSGFRVSWGHCYEWEGTPAYWPWVEVLRDLVEGSDPGHLRDQLGDGAPIIAQIVPEVRHVLPDVPDVPPMGPEQARFQFFDAVARFLRDAARLQPLMLALDDLHWADPPSLLLLEFVAREVGDAPLLLTGSYRDAEVRRDHPLAQTLADLTRVRTVRRLKLGSLERGSVAEIVRQLTGVATSERLVDAVFAETGGNALFVTEVARWLAAQPDIGSDDSGTVPLAIPEGVREAIGRRLDRLSLACNETLAIATVIGRDFQLDLLERVSDRSVDDLLDALDEAAAAGVITDSETFGRYRFNHALIQDTLYDEIPTSRRVRLHSALGHALEQIHGDDLGQVYGELARHFISAPIGENLDKAIAYATKAGEQAMAQLAWESAIGHFQRAADLLESLPGVDKVRLCDVLLALGGAQDRVAAGRPSTGIAGMVGAGASPGALATFQRAATIAREAGAPEQLARAALGVAGFNPIAQQSGFEGVRLLEEALERQPSGDSRLRAQLLARLGVDLYMLSVIAGDPPFTDDLEERLRTVSDSAVAMARRLGDPATLGYALVRRSLRTLLHSPDERLAIGNEVVDLATATEDLSLLHWGMLARNKALCQRGDTTEARRTMDERAELAQRLHIPFFSWTVAVDEAMFAFGAGRFADAEQWIDRADDIQPVSGVATFQRITLRREQGRMDELMPLVERLGLVNSHPRYGGVYDAFQLICQLETGQRHAVREEFERRATNGFADRSIVLRSLTLVAEVCAEIQDTDRARLLYERLLPNACLNVHIEISDLTGGSVSYYLGLLATTMSRWDDAERHFADALAMNQEWGIHVYVAYTRYAWADMLVRRGRSSDRERAWDLLGQARTAAEEIGMVRLLKLIDALEGRMGKPEARYPAGLTPREIEVLCLISQGMTDAEAAERLYLSRRTISSHLTSIYNKLGVNSRAAATRFAVEQGLT